MLIPGLPEVTPYPSREKPIPDGTTVTIQVRRADLAKLSDQSLYHPVGDYPSPELSRLPRFYGITIEVKVFVTSRRTLWNSPYPYLPGSLCRVLVLFTEFYFILRLAGMLRRKTRECILGFTQ